MKSFASFFPDKKITANITAKEKAYKYMREIATDDIFRGSPYFDIIKNNAGFFDKQNQKQVKPKYLTKEIYNDFINKVKHTHKRVGTIKLTRDTYRRIQSGDKFIKTAQIFKDNADRIAGKYVVLTVSNNKDNKTYTFDFKNKQSGKEIRQLFSKNVMTVMGDMLIDSERNFIDKMINDDGFADIELDILPDIVRDENHPNQIYADAPIIGFFTYAKNQYEYIKLFKQSEDKQQTRNIENAIYLCNQYIKTTNDIIMIDQIRKVANALKTNIRIYSNNIIRVDEQVEQPIYTIEYFNTQNHCVLDPIYKYYESQTRKQMKIFKTKADELKQKYPTGVPEENLQEVCDILRCKIVINDIAIDSTRTYKHKSPYATFEFYNNRSNHLSCSKNIITEKQTKDELYKTYKNLITNKTPFMSNAIRNIKLQNETVQMPTRIYTDIVQYEITQADNEKITQWYKDTSLNRLAYNIKSNADLYNFVRHGVRFTSHIIINKPTNEERQPKQRDMKKAYTQFKKCKYYKGFPSTMPIFANSDYTIEFIKKTPGYYYIENINMDNVNPNTKRILNAFTFFEGNSYVLTQPEICYFSDIGITFTCTTAAISPNPIHFEFSDEMINSKLYANAVGMMNCENNTTTFKYHNAPKTFAYQLRSLYPQHVQIHYNDNNSTIDITRPNNNVKTLHHVAGYITAYTRLNILDVLTKLPYDDIIGVRLDSVIYYGDHANKFPDYFHNEENYTKSFEGWPTEIYYADDDINRPTSTLIPSLSCNSHLSGAGGTGKTHTFITNGSYRNILYVTRAWSLVAEKIKDYKIPGDSFSRLIGANCESYLDKHIAYPTTIFIDESTMIDNNEMAKVYRMYPYSLIVTAGDIDRDGHYFQCSIGDNVYKPNNNIIEFVTDYRAKDDKLKELKTEIRKIMKHNYETRNEIYEYNELQIEKMNEYLNDNNYVSEDYLIKNMKQTDMLLVSTKSADSSQMNYYNKLLKINKYRCVKHTETILYNRINTGDREKYPLNGEILYNEQPNTERQVACTIHGVQGVTVKSPTMLYMDLSKLFDPNMLYTAISRCETIEQIRIVIKNNDD